MSFEMREERGFPLLFQTYLQTVKNSVSSHQFRNLYMEQGGRSVDVLEDGNLSCAYYVSSLLMPLGLIQRPHTWVKNTVHDLRSSGWEATKVLEPGCILVWAAKVGESGRSHKHIGFYIGGGRAISNDDRLRSPQEHDADMGGRHIDLILDHYALER